MLSQLTISGVRNIVPYRHPVILATEIARCALISSPDALAPNTRGATSNQVDTKIGCRVWAKRCVREVLFSGTVQSGWRTLTAIREVVELDWDASAESFIKMSTALPTSPSLPKEKSSLSRELQAHSKDPTKSSAFGWRIASDHSISLIESSDVVEWRGWIREQNERNSAWVEKDEAIYQKEEAVSDCEGGGKIAFLRKEESEDNTTSLDFKYAISVALLSQIETDIRGKRYTWSWWGGWIIYMNNLNLKSTNDKKSTAEPWCPAQKWDPALSNPR
jgi:hypothetical protein